MNQPPANPMKLKFDMTVEDWIAFNVHHFRTSASGQSNSRRVAVVATLIPFSAAILFAAAGLNSLPLWLICGVLGLVLFFSVRRNYPAAIEKQTRRLLQEGSNKGLLGERELEIEPDGIVQRTELSALKKSSRPTTMSSSISLPCQLMCYPNAASHPTNFKPS
jgi:hypothetical protein